MTKAKILEDLQRAHRNLTTVIENDLSINPNQMSKLTPDEQYRLLKIDTDAINLVTDISFLIKILQTVEENKDG